jgi:hypothetical protein
MSSSNKNNNSTSIPLKLATEFVGLAQSTTGYSNILVNIRTDKKAELTIQQSADKINWDLHSLWTCDPAKSPTGFLVQEPASLPFFRVKLLNTSGEDMTRLRLVSVLNLTSNVKLNVRQDNTLVSGEDELGEKHTLLTDASGALVIGGTTPSGTLNVNIVSPDPLPTYDLSANTTLTSIDSKVGLQGQNTDFAFFPDATNSSVTIYADEQPPTTTTSAGWTYTNTNPQKINWYIYQNTTLPQYAVSQMDSVYFVITHFTSGSQFPYIVIYTMPDGVNDAVPNFAKSIITFQYGGADKALGQYLFYVNSDPVGVRPDIPAGNRFALTYFAGSSTKTLAQAANERIASTNISTSTSALTGEYNFLLQQYGLTWEKTSVPLPVNNGLLDCNIVSQPAVVLTTGTANIGFVNLKAENLLSDPQTFSNLQMVNQYLEVEDQQAHAFLVSIDDNTNSMNATLNSISSYNQSMESRLVNMDTKMITLSNGASTKTLTQTGANWTAGYSTLQSLTLSNVGGLVFSYVKLYNKATAPDQNDTPIMTIPLNHETVQQVVCNTLLFDLGIGVRATNAFASNDNTAPSGTVYATAFYKLG